MAVLQENVVVEFQNGDCLHDKNAFNGLKILINLIFNLLSDEESYN